MNDRVFVLTPAAEDTRDIKSLIRYASSSNLVLSDASVRSRAVLELGAGCSSYENGCLMEMRSWFLGSSSDLQMGRERHIKDWPGTPSA
jgi:hypothetical protein